MSAVPLPKRSEAPAPGGDVWPVAASPSDDTLSSDCETRTVCCKDLKGDDERHLIDPDIVRDVIIGLADGLTVPFALTAGLSSLGSSRLVYVAGIAELVSGALSMGVGGYLSAQAERDHFIYLKKHTRDRVIRSCSSEMEREVAEILHPYGISRSLSNRIANSLMRAESEIEDVPPPKDESFWTHFFKAIARFPKMSTVTLPSNATERTPLVSPETAITIEDNTNKPPSHDHEQLGLSAFLLKFGENQEETTDSRLLISAFTIGASYFLGGLVPLLPYFFIDSARIALYWSIVVTTVVLLLFGTFKTYFTGAKIGVKGYAYGAFSTLAVGGTAAAASFAIVRALET